MVVPIVPMKIPVYVPLDDPYKPLIVVEPADVIHVAANTE
jgi:hypothetical protein